MGMKNKIMNIEGNRALVLEVKGTRATILKFVETCGMLQATMEQVDVDKLTAFSCPYHEKEDPTRIYCIDGKCEYPIQESSPSMVQFACMLCLKDSYENLVGN